MKELTVLKTTISIGLKTPVKFLHVTDTHITRDDRVDNGRAAVFDTTDDQIESFWHQTVAYAKEQKLPIIHTGDLIDYITPQTIDFVDKYLDDVDYVLATGSHDYAHHIPGGQEYRDWCAAGGGENDAFKAEQIKTVAPHFKNNLYFASKQIGEINVVVLDNSYLHITDGQLEALKAEVAKGYPVVVAMHIPMHTKGLQELGLAPRENLCSTEEDQRAHAQNHNRPDLVRDIRRYDDATWRAIDYIKTEPMIKVVLTGHRHRNIEEQLGENKYQIMTRAGCQGVAREITLI